MTDFLERLKRDTRDEHLATEEALGLLGAGQTLDSYRRLIGRLHGFYRVVEPGLHAAHRWPAPDLDPTARRRLPWLHADLLALAMDESTLPDCQHVPRLDTRAQRFGCLYVLEGSSLGGAVIARHLREHLGITDCTGGRYFAGYGARTGSMWNAFRASLTAYAYACQCADRTGTDSATDSATEREVVAGARSAFRTLRAWCQSEAFA